MLVYQRVIGAVFSVPKVFFPRLPNLRYRALTKIRLRKVFWSGGFKAWSKYLLMQKNQKNIHFTSTKRFNTQPLSIQKKHIHLEKPVTKNIGGGF